MSEIAVLTSALPRIERACRAHGARDPVSGASVTERQALTLRQLDPVDPVMVTELADFLGVTASTMSLNLKRLEVAGLVRRTRDPADRRVMNVLLTDAGVRVRDSTQRVDPERVAALLDRLRPEERSRVVKALARLADAADELRSA
jgi:DNA-binding MarR family transcriptional regulator